MLSVQLASRASAAAPARLSLAASTHPIVRRFGPISAIGLERSRLEGSSGARAHRRGRIRRCWPDFHGIRAPGRTIPFRLEPPFIGTRREPDFEDQATDPRLCHCHLRGAAFRGRCARGFAGRRAPLLEWVRQDGPAQARSGAAGVQAFYVAAPQKGHPIWLLLSDRQRTPGEARLAHAGSARRNRVRCRRIRRTSAFGSSAQRTRSVAALRLRRALRRSPIRAIGFALFSAIHESEQGQRPGFLAAILRRPGRYRTLDAANDRLGGSRQAGP
jgi:hypothetical protein